MGKRTNTKQILQVGKKNNKYIWDSKYLEKQNNESQIYLFQSIEIKNFFKNFFKIYGLSLYKYSINFLESSLKIYISYFKTSAIKKIISRIKTHKLKLVRKKKKIKKYLYKNLLFRKKKKKIFKTNKNLKKKIFSIFYNFSIIYFKHFYYFNKRLQIILKYFHSIYILKILIKKNHLLSKLNYFLLKKYIYVCQYFNKLKLNIILKKKIIVFYNKYVIKQRIKTFINNVKLQKIVMLQYQKFIYKNLVKYNNYKNLFKIFLLNKKLYKKRLKILRYYKNYVKISDNKNIQTLKKKNFLKQCIESLNIFTKKKFNNSLILNQVNNNIIFNLTYRQLQLLKKLVSQLRQFKNSNFYKKGINIILSTLINLNSTDLLVNYIALNLQIEKRHGFFLKFLVKIFSLLVKHKFSKVKSVKILINGRLNGKPRSKKKLIVINNNMSLMTINSPIYFNQSTAYSLNGTFGVKLWVG